jgi:hypothetical protein
MASMKNHRLFLASQILVAASVLSVIMIAPTAAVTAQSQLVNDLIDRMPCVASCQWVYNIDSGRLCERDAEFGCANVGHDMQCNDTATVTCTRAE